MKRYVLFMLLALIISFMKVNVVFGEDYNKLVSPHIFSDVEGLKFKFNTQAEVDKYTKELKIKEQRIENREQILLIFFMLQNIFILI